MALPFLLLAATAGISAFKGYSGIRGSKKAERSAIGEIEESQNSIRDTISGIESRKNYINQGAAMDQRMIDIQFEQTKLSALEKSLQNLENLRENLSGQRAIFAARGQAIGQGPAVIAAQKSINKFGRTEEARRLNTSFKTVATGAQKQLVELHRQYGLEEAGHQIKGLEHDIRGLGMKKNQIRKEGKRSRRDTILGTGLNLLNFASGFDYGK